MDPVRPVCFVANVHARSIGILWVNVNPKEKTPGGAPRVSPNQGACIRRGLGSLVEGFGTPARGTAQLD